MDTKAPAQLRLRGLAPARPPRPGPRRLGYARLTPSSGRRPRSSSSSTSSARRRRSSSSASLPSGTPTSCGRSPPSGHDLACHGYDHRRVPTQSRDEFKRTSNAAPSSSSSSPASGPVGYRAPAFSITRETPWAYEVLAELGFRYDSSQYDSPRIPQRIRDVPRTPVPARARRGTRDLGVPGHRLAGPRPLGPDGRRRLLAALPTSVLRRALSEVTAENSYPVLYFHPYELDPQPLRATLPESPTPKQRALAAWKSVQRNPGRRLVADRIRAIARDYTLTSYEEAHGEVVERYGARPRSLSRAGVVALTRSTTRSIRSSARSAPGC